MKRVVWKDDSGVVRCSLLRDQDDENLPTIGIPLNPPPIERIVADAALEIRNALVSAGVVTYRDLQKHPNEVSSVLDRILRRRLVEAYKLEDLSNGIIE